MGNLLGNFLVAAEDDLKSELSKGRFATWGDVERWVHETCQGTELVLIPIRARSLISESVETPPVGKTEAEQAYNLLYDELLKRADVLWEAHKDAREEREELVSDLEEAENIISRVLEQLDTETLGISPDRCKAIDRALSAAFESLCSATAALEED